MVGYVAKKSKILTQQEVNTFLRKAPDEVYLLTKVILIIGIAGACRTDELTNMTIDDVVKKDDIFNINVPDTKNNKERTFTICNSQKENSIDVISICAKYFNLRPENMNSSRLFIRYNAGKCASQNVGYHTIGAMPIKIATYLNLPNIKEYTGHCFRRTSATFLADSGADILLLKRHGGWKSTSVAEGYVENSIENKISIANKILNTKEKTDESIIIETPPAKKQGSTVISKVSEQIELSHLSKQGISFADCTMNNPVFNINISNM